MANKREKRSCTQLISSRVSTRHMVNSHFGSTLWRDGSTWGAENQPPGLWCLLVYRMPSCSVSPPTFHAYLPCRLWSWFLWLSFLVPTGKPASWVLSLEGSLKTNAAPPYVCVKTDACVKKKISSSYIQTKAARTRSRDFTP